MLTIVLAAPGSGKSALAPLLRRSLPRHVVLDWDDFIAASSALAGRDVKRSPDLWPTYRQLVRSVVDAVQPWPTVVLGVCTPDELADWPPADWMVLDCEDNERRLRLADRPSAETEDAVADAREYRRLGLPVIDTSGRPVEMVVSELTARISGG